MCGVPQVGVPEPLIILTSYELKEHFNIATNLCPLQGQLFQKELLSCVFSPEEEPQCVYVQTPSCKSETVSGISDKNIYTLAGGSPSLTDNSK